MKFLGGECECDCGKITSPGKNYVRGHGKTKRLFVPIIIIMMEI
jgi:ribosomal protein L28